MNLFLVALGGASGSVLRYLLGAFVSRHAPTDFPYATLAVNILGCFVIGLLGGFTTFSAFGLETYSLFRSGHPTLAALNIVASLVCTLAAVALGVRLGRLWI